jgi:hypothetical protein
MRGADVLVDEDFSQLTERDARLFGTDAVGVGPPSGRDEKALGAQLAGLSVDAHRGDHRTGRKAAGFVAA